MARTGRAAVFHGPGQPFEIRELALPELEPGAVLVRVSLANVCGSDLHFWRGDAPLALPPDGWIFGHEMTGRVAALGAGVTTDSLGQPLREGDRVAYCYFYPCGRCYVCLHGQRAACPHKIGRATGPGEFPHWVGAFAEYYYVRPGGFVFRVPDDLPDALVSPVNCALSQVLFGLTRAGLAFGESVLIQGAGGLGIQAVAVARDMGAGTVIVVDQLRRAARARPGVRRRPHAQPRRGPGPPRPRQAGARLDRLGAAPISRATSSASRRSCRKASRCCATAGRYLEIGCISRGRTVEFDPSSLVWGSKTIIGVVMYDPWVIPRALEFLQRSWDRYPFDRLVSHTYPLDRIDDAFRDAEWYNREAVPSRLTRAALAP